MATRDGRSDKSETLTIDHVGHRGDGVAYAGDKPVFVPFTLAGETVQARRIGDHFDLVSVETPSSDRADPICRHYGRCGGCALQHMAGNAYQAWKRDQVASALAKRGLDVAVSDIEAASPGTRRRAVFTAVRAKAGVVLGYHQRQSHTVVDIRECPVLESRIVTALDDLRQTASIACPKRGQLRLTVLASPAGLDVTLGDTAPLTNDLRQRLIQIAISADWARLTADGETLIETRPPALNVDGAHMVPPPGAFVQAVANAEKRMAEAVITALRGAKRAADLFCGAGAFTLRIARHAAVHGVESERGLLEALDQAVRRSSGLKPVSTERRDLFRHPLTPGELNVYDAIVFDPPRAGAKTQAEMLAQSKVPTVAAISCNPSTLARDLRILCDGGYAIESVTPVDQFLWSPHIEAVAILKRR